MPRVSVLRKPSVSDICEIMRAFSHAFSPSLDAVISNFDQYAVKIRDNASVVVAREGNDVVGFCFVYVNRAPTAYISFIAVSPDWRGKGIGTLLLRRCERIASRAGMSQVKLAVDKVNAGAIAFYVRNGFSCAESSSDTQYYFVKSIAGSA